MPKHGQEKIIMKSSFPLMLLNLFRKDKLRNFQELERSQWLSTDEIKEIQNHKFLKLISHCKKNVPYYSAVDALDSIGSLDDIGKLPFLTKDMITENLRSLQASNYPAKRFKLNSTSGSTGKTLRFYSDSENIMSLGILMRNNMWTGWNIGEKQAMLWGANYDILKAKNVFSRVKNQFIHKMLYLSSYDMTEENMLNYLDKINKYKPRLITAYPSGIYEFASFLEKSRLNIHSPEAVIVSAETLFEYQREKIETVFNCKVFNRYGCRELANIAHQCEVQDGLHINSEHVYVEIINEAGKPCRPGELGEIVVTDLDNYVFPFLRYKIGDIGRLSDKTCACGRGLPLLESVEGRVFDVIIGANGNKLVGSFWLVKDIPGIKQFQIVQEKFDSIDVRLVVDENYEEKLEQILIERIYQYCGKNMKARIQFIDEIPLTSSGKFRFVISKCSPFINNR